MKRDSLDVNDSLGVVWFGISFFDVADHLDFDRTVSVRDNLALKRGKAVFGNLSSVLAFGVNNLAIDDDFELLVLLEVLHFVVHSHVTSPHVLNRNEGFQDELKTSRYSVLQSVGLKQEVSVGMPPEVHRAVLVIAS